MVKYLFIKLKKILYLIIKNELLRVQYKYIFLNCNLPFFLRQEAFFNMNEMEHNSSLSKSRMRCFLTNKSYFVLKSFNLARFISKLWAFKGKSPGIKKISW